MNDTERLNLETENLVKLKQHLNAILNLRPIERLSPLSISILKNSKVFIDEIAAWAGSLSSHLGLDTAFKDLLDDIKLKCTAEEVEVIELALETFEWISEYFEGFPFSVCETLRGDEVLWAWEFLYMTDEQIRAGDERDGEKRLGRRRVVLKSFADLGIDIFEHGERVN